MILKDIRIGTQLRIGFGIILCLIITLGIISLLQTDKIANHTREMYEHPFTVRYALGKLNTDIMAMRLEFRNFFLAKNEKDRQTAVVNSALYESDAKKQLEILKSQYLGPAIDVEEANDAFIRWVELRSGNRELARAGRFEEAWERIADTGDIGMAREQLLKCINKIDVFASNKGKEFYTNTTIIQDTLNRQLAIIVIGILALSVLIVSFINNNIRVPLAQITDATQQFMKGKTQVRSSYVSDNEFGQLSSTFNDLANTIETELILNTQAAKLAEVMLSESDTHRFCHVLLNNLNDFTGAQMGAFYLLNDEKTSFVHFESIGMIVDNNKSFSVSHYEGVFGAAIASQKLKHIKEMPLEDNFIFSTINAAYRPKEIITLPIVSENTTIAVLSLFTVNHFTNNNLKLLDTISGILRARIEGILAHQKIIHFTQQLESQNSELEVQKQELSTQTHELSEQNVELEMQKKQLDDANRMKTSFLSNMSHELRTPLNSIIALSSVLNHRLEGIVASEEYSYLDVIERNGKILLSLINDILDLSRIESGFEEVELSRFNVKDLMDEVIEMIHPQAVQKSIYLRNETKEALPSIKSDIGKCTHILQNLVANAVKFTSKGGVGLSAELKGEKIHITIKDTGIGIDEKHLPFIFDEFRQADGSNSRKYGGTGLGLAIARKYAEMLNGSIHVESVLGQGSCFTLVLPVNYTDDEDIEHSEALHIHEKSQQVTPERNEPEETRKNILLVEDAEAVVIQLKDVLSKQGYNIRVAGNGQKALEMIAELVPDGIILDLMMPGVDGFEVLRRIREGERTDRLPVIILTAKYVTKEELAFLKNNNILQLIQKGDINKDQLLDAVSKMISGVKTGQKDKLTEGQISKSEKPLILIVEDNPDNMITIRTLLDDQFRILEAEYGSKALGLANTCQPDLILMDISLPQMNGIEVLTELRKIDNTKDIPVIAVSANAMVGNEEEFLKHGFDDYISKPIDVEIFKKKITQYIKQ